MADNNQMKNVGDSLKQQFNRNPMFKERQAKIEGIVQSDPDVQAFLAKHQLTFEDEIVKKSFSKLYEFARENGNDALGQKKFVQYAPNLIMNVNFIDVDYHPTEAFIQQQEAEELNKRVTMVSMPKSLRSASFEKMTKDDYQDRFEAIQKSLQFISAYTSKPNAYHKGLYLHGQFGVGKTHILAALVNTLAEHGVKSTLVHYPELLVDLKSRIRTNTVDQRVNEIKQAQVLVLDDIGAESNSEWVRDDVLGVILQYRMQEQLSTFFTSNFSMAELEEFLMTTREGVDVAKSARIMERIKYLSEEITVGGRDRRNG